MKTFTTCAEKKAKQFFNLLQGYTRGIRMTAILILLLMGVSNAWAYSLYLYTGSFTSWEQDNVGFRIWDGSKDVEFTSLGNHWYRCETTKTGNTYFNRFSNNTNHNSFQVNISSTNNVVKVTDWGSGALTSLHITGNEWGGIGNWNNKNDGGKMAITSGSTFTKTFTNISNSAHKFKITFWGAWENAIAYNSSNVSCVNGTVKGDGTDDNNIEFTPDNTGDVTITYNVSTGKVVITCAAPTDEYTVTLDNQGATTAGTTSVTATYNAAMPSITKPTKTGYTFGGYYTSTNGGGTQYYTANGTSARTWNIAENTTLYAKWTANQYTITYKDQGDATFSGTHSSNPPTTHTYGTTTTLKTATKTGYTFGGWYKEKECTNKVTSLGATDYIDNITLYAKWTINTYTITFGVKDGGGTVKATVDGSEIASGAKVEYNKQVVFTATADANNVFSKWVNGSGSQLSTQNPYTHTVSGDATVKAVFLKPTTVYLKPSDNWKQANARFAVYWWADGDKNGWIDMMAVGCNNEYYRAEIPAGVTNFQFVRLKPNSENGYDPSNSGLNYGNAWNQTDNLTIQQGKYLYDMTQTPKKHIFLKPNTNWKTHNAWFAVYFYNSGNSDNIWKKMTHHSDGVYGCEWPSGYTHVIFVRMKEDDSTSLNFNNSWNQTKDLGYNGNDNMFTIGEEHWGNKELGADGSWSIFYDNCYWNTLALPTVTFSQSSNGSVTVQTSGGETITTDSSVDFDTEIIVTVTPNAGYAVNTATITIGDKQQTLYSGENTITVCGNTSIDVSFKQKAEWYIIGIDGNWGLQEKYKFIDGRVYVDLGEKADKTFKIAKASGGSVDNSNQYGNKTFQGHDNSHTLTLANNLGGDATIKMVHNGGYVFVWDEDTKKLTIEYPNVCYLHGEFNDLHGEINDWKDNEAHALHNQVAMVKLERNQEYEFKVADKGVYRTSNAYGTPIQASGTITMDDETAYNGDSRGWHNCKIKATVTGIYRFSYNRETHVLTITYPEGSEPKVGDYRLAYKNSTSGSFHPAHFISKNTTASEKLDTVSFFVDTISMTPQIILQKCTNVSNGKGTWANVGSWQDVAVEAAGVYNFVLKQTNSGDTHNAEIDMSKKHAYTGHYYIRTNCAAGGWEAYNVASSMMTYSSYADKHENFDHYYCEWVENTTENVSFTIANDYSYCVSDTMTTDNIATNSCLPGQKASVRFGWDSKSNELSRAYLSGSTNISDRFLVLIGDAKLKDANGNNFNVKDLNIHETNFADLQNWIYQVDVTASKDTYVKLTARYNGIVQYFHGSQDAGAQLLTSSDESEYKMRIIYDFKTNHLVAAWLGGGNTIEGENRELGAEMMIIRKNQNKAEQLLFNPNTNTLGSVETVYAVTTFTKDFITSDRTQYERALYWVSFPFDVRIGEVFGFGEYGDHWIIQYYDGAARAKYGLFEDSGTYWRCITSTDSVLHKNTGYVLTLDLDKVAQSFLHDATEVSLYFPSTDDLGTITGTLPQSVSVTGHKCEIVMPDATQENKRDRRIYDSHWNMIGVPVFADVNGFLTDPAYVRDGISFYYEYLPATNSYQATNKTADFQTMYGYMVQFAGTINWSSKDVTFNPNQKLAARRNSESDEPEKISFRLEIAQGEEMADQTFVQMQQEGATTEFDMNLDLTKIINSGANIYTLTGEQRIQSAGNALPMGEAIVPVGVQIAAEGEYTFRMPDGTEGMVVELVDYETNTRTNLLLSDYIVTLPKGTSENRFALHIQPQKDVVTSLENIGEGVNNGEAVNKYLIDGKLIIRTAGGVVYDAQGRKL